MTLHPTPRPRGTPLVALSRCPPPGGPNGNRSAHREARTGDRINDWATVNTDRVTPRTIEGVPWFAVDGIWCWWTSRSPGQHPITATTGTAMTLMSA